MDHHVDIDLRSDPETAPHQLMSALFATLHRSLVARTGSRIGVSFPGVDAKGPHLGTRLRLHGSLPELSSLLSTDWLGALHDHLTVHAPAAVPATAQHRVVQRVQTKSNPERLRRRLMRRHGLDETEAARRIPDEVARFAQLPFVQLRSTSTGQTYRVFIKHGPMFEVPEPGDFGAYGLSRTGTVPWF